MTAGGSSVVDICVAKGGRLAAGREILYPRRSRDHEGKQMSVLRSATPERLNAFSDGVFAVLITVLVLDLRPPEAPTFDALLKLWPNWLSYAVSYLFIAIVWVNH